jgi:hypothetical protein
VAVRHLFRVYQQICKLIEHKEHLTKKVREA